MHRTLHTTRLTLRPLVSVDASWLTATWRLPEVHRNVASIPPKVTEDFARKRIQRELDGEEAGTNIARILEMEGQRIGMIGLNRAAHQGAFELGYMLHPDFWAKGVMTEAARALLKWTDSFASTGYYVSGHFTDNPASGAVLKKLGFLPCWRGPVYSAGRDAQVDHLYMSRLI